MGEIQRTDPGARRIAVVVVLVAGLLGSALLVATGGVGPDFEQWAAENVHYLVENSWLAGLAVAVMMSPVAGFSIYLRRYGSDVVSNERFPLPGQEVVRDTPVRFGREAVRHGRILQVLAGALLVACATVPYLFWRIFDSLAH
jgi:hypothetical protein